MMRILRLARPQFLVTSLFLCLMGSLWAVLLGSPFLINRFLLGYLSVLPAHLSVSFSNDYFDTEVDSYATPSSFSGGSGVLVQYPELRKTSRLISIALIALSIALAFFLYFFFSFSGLFVVIIITGNFLGWFYAAPPLRFSYRGLGEISTAIIASLLPVLGYLMIERHIKPEALLLIPPSFLCGLAFILTVEIPDEAADRLGSKRTWIVRLGGDFGFIAIAACMFSTTVYFFLFRSLYPDPLPINSYTLGLLSMIPLSAGLYGVISKSRQALGKTKVVNLIIVSLAVFLLLVNGYFLLLATAN